MCMCMCVYVHCIVLYCIVLYCIVLHLIMAGFFWHQELVCEVALQQSAYDCG
jgi:hypothetical protein